MASVRIIFILYFFVSCVQPSGINEEERQSILSSAKITLQNYFRDIRREGLLAEFRYLDSTADFFWVPPGYSSAISYDSVHTLLTKASPMYKAVDNSWQAINIFPLSKELASYTGKIHSKMTDISGNTIEMHLVETGLLVKKKDGWKLLCGQTTKLED